MPNKKTVRFRVVIVGGLLLLFMVIFGQAMAFINYDFTVSLGLQESKSIIGEMGVAVNKGFGVGDTAIYLPLLVFGLVGLWLEKRWGVFLMALADRFNVYVAFCQRHTWIQFH